MPGCGGQRVLEEAGLQFTRQALMIRIWFWCRLNYHYQYCDVRKLHSFKVGSMKVQVFTVATNGRVGDKLCSMFRVTVTSTSITSINLIITTTIRLSEAL